MTLDAIVSDYIRNYRDDARAEMRFFAARPLPSTKPRCACSPGASWSARKVVFTCRRANIGLFD